MKKNLEWKKCENFYENFSMNQFFFMIERTFQTIFFAIKTFKRGEIISFYIFYFQWILLEIRICLIVSSCDVLL